MKPRLLATLLTAMCGLPILAQTPAELAARDSELSCRVCHPGSVRGLRQTPHSVLLDRPDLRGKACASCHGDLSAHAHAAGHHLTPLPEVPKVTAAKCASCHTDNDYAPSRGLHRIILVGSGAAPLPDPETSRIEELERTAADPGIDWSGFLDLGYRAVHHSGSRDAFRTDLDLPSTALIRDFEVRGTGHGAATFDDVTLRGADLGDPRWDVGLAASKADRFDVDSTYRRDRYLYEVSGDYHRVDRDSHDSTTTFRIDGDGWRLFGSYRDLTEDGFWLTQRIGNRNLPVQTVVNGVSNPSRVRSHNGELGIGGTLGPLEVTVSGSYYEQRDTESWSYSQPATVNPLFTESDDLSTSSRLDGPSGRLIVTHDGGPFFLQYTGLARDLERNLDTTGTGSGFDTVAFTTQTSGTGSGRARLLDSQFEGAFECTDSLRLLLYAHYRDYEERMSLRLEDVRTVPSLGTSVTTNTDVDDETVQRLFETDLAFEWNPHEDFDLSLGYGLAREQLRLTPPVTADPQDFRSGDLDDNGVLASLRWRFAPEWTLRGEGRDFAADGVFLSELTPQNTRHAMASLDWRRDTNRASLFARHRHNDNDISEYRLDAFSTGINGSGEAGPTSVFASYTYANTDSQVRTNFYYDPDPDPVPTLVGFDGETHTWNATMHCKVQDHLRVELTGTMTRTVGSFDVDTFDARCGLLWQCSSNGAAGIEWRHVSYADQNEVDDFSADLIYVFWRADW